MVRTELPSPTTLRALACPGVDTDALVGEMTGELPRGGMAAAALPPGRRLATASLRLLDSRILSAAVEIIDIDVARQLVTCLGRLQRLREAAASTLTDPAQPEVVETLLEPYPLTVTDDLGVEIHIDGRLAATIRFHLDVAAALGETSLVVRLGEMSDVVWEALTVSATLTLVGWPRPLWKAGPLALPRAHLPLRPPLPVPLLPAPRASSDPDPDPGPDPGPRRATGRPPVPHAAGAADLRGTR